MVLDDALLKKAQAQATRLAEAERQVLLVRADYHTAVRRLHLSGASLREVAQTLGLSHQRVQQIVGGAGGTWWTRAWRSRNRPYGICTGCERPPGEVEKLIAGPDVFICDACLDRAEQALAKPASGRSAKGARTPRKCGFCGSRARDVRVVSPGPELAICERCVQSCREILDGRSSA